jgi:NADH-ubiquinone oxidoreductase chain 6
MLNLLVLYDLFNGFWLGFLDLLALVSVILGIFIIVTKNPVISVLFLILLFSSIAGYLILLGVKFIGISYLLVYVGAVSILFLFILMLINIRISELISDTNNNIPLALVTILTFVVLFTTVIPEVSVNSGMMGKQVYTILQDILNIDNLEYVTSKNWDGNLVDNTDIISIGNIMYTSYSIWLLITSIILLLAMVGAIVITIKQRI